MTLPVALTVAYDGAPFAGFARQDGLETVQGRLESALGTVMRAPVTTVGAGRTDAGVHALGQVVSFEPPLEIADHAALLRSVGALTGPSIAIRESRLAREGFSARFDAVSREYRYRIVAGPVAPVFLAPWAWHVPAELDAEAMARAAAVLVGEHDFRSFCVASSAEGRSTTRRVDTVELDQAVELGEAHLVVRIVGNAFLHSMVRVIVGSLVEVGRGARDPGWIGDALAARARSAAGPTAPPHGLTLWRVEYPEECWA